MSKYSTGKNHDAATKRAARHYREEKGGYSEAVKEVDRAAAELLDVPVEEVTDALDNAPEPDLSDDGIADILYTGE
jgi:hypothetical protein